MRYVLMIENNVVETESTRKGTVKINVSPLVKDRLLHLQYVEQHTSMDSVIRTLLMERMKQTLHPSTSELERLEQ